MYTYNCKILNVVDGDTVDILIDLGFEITIKERVRLLDVNTPEVYGKKATVEGREGKIASSLTKEWVEKRSNVGQFLYMSRKYNARDKFGRSLGYIIWHNDSTREVLNEALIAAGWKN